LAYPKKSSPGLMLVSTVLSSLEEARSRGACAQIPVAENSQQKSDGNAILNVTRRRNA
jgi:hypothetical protein